MASRYQRILQPTLKRSLQQPQRWTRSFSTTPIPKATSSDPNAQLQSEATKTENFKQAAEDMGIKMQAAPHSITSEEANHLKSREARATHQAQPPADSISAEAQRLAAQNEGATKSTSSSSAPSMDRAEQSAAAKAANFENVADEMVEKLETEPGNVTKEDAGKVHSREQRAFGTTSKGGVASEVHKVADENEKRRQGL